MAKNYKKLLLVTVCGLAKYRLAHTFKYNTKACGGILPNHCYKPFLLVFGLTLNLNKMILSFELTMPNVGSWNGQWTGQGSKYYRHRKVSKQEAEKILQGKERNSWYYNFGDGWGASVSVVKVLAGEKNKRDRISKGFAGYDWMIDEILKYGRILERQERQEMRKQETVNGVPVVSV